MSQMVPLSFRVIFRLALIVLPLAVAVGAHAQNSAGVQNQNAHPFAVRPKASTNAFSVTPPANTNAFAHSVHPNTNALGTSGAGRTTAFGHNGVSTTAGGKPAVGTANANRAANSFGTSTDQGASPVGGHNQTGKSGG